MHNPAKISNIVTELGAEKRVNMLITSKLDFCNSLMS